MQFLFFSKNGIINIYLQLSFSIRQKKKNQKKIKSENSNPIEKIHNTTDSFLHYLVGDETDRTLLSISIHPMFPCFLAFDCHINHSV